VGLLWPNGIVQGLFGGEAHSSLGSFLFSVKEAADERGQGLTHLFCGTLVGAVKGGEGEGVVERGT